MDSLCITYPKYYLIAIHSRLDLGLNVCISLIPKFQFVVINSSFTELLLDFPNFTLVLSQEVSFWL